MCETYCPSTQVLTPGASKMKTVQNEGGKIPTTKCDESPTINTITKFTPGTGWAINSKAISNEKIKNQQSGTSSQNTDNS